MTRRIHKSSALVALATAAWLGNGQIATTGSAGLPGLLTGGLMATAEAVVGRPATPVSYADVARRSTVRAATPGVGAGGVGGPASGFGVLPGAGAGQAGVGYSGGVGVNLGGPVNRAGVRGTREVSNTQPLAAFGGTGVVCAHFAPPRPT